MDAPRIARIVLASCLALPAACLKVPPELPEEAGGPRSAPTTAAELLERHVEAIGGAEALQGLKQRAMEARMVVEPEEGCVEGDGNCLAEPQTGSFYLYTTADGKMYRRTVLPGILEERAFDGKVGWKMQNGTLAFDDAATLALAKEDAILHWYFDLEARGVQISLLSSRKEDSEGAARVMDGLRWEHADGTIPAKSMWFERQTGLLREEIIEEDIGQGLTSRQVIIHESYQEVDGIKVDERIRLVTEVGDRAQILTFTSQSIDHEPDPKVAFAAPELPDPDPQPDARLERLAAAREAAKVAPKDASAQVAWARAAWAAAHFEEATEAAKATLALDRREPEALYMLVQADLMTGDIRGAQKMVKKAKAAGVRKDALARQLAWIHERQGDYRKVADELEAIDATVIAARYRSFAGKPLVVTKRPKSCRTEVPMLGTNPPVVEIELGTTKVQAIIDTGARNTIVADDLVTDAGVIVQGEAPLVAGAPPVKYGQLPKLAVGEVGVKNVPVDVFPAQQLGAMGAEGTQVRAVLSARALGAFQITFDTLGKRFVLVSDESRCKSALAEARGGVATPFWLHEGHLVYTLATMNGAEGLYLVNTAMRGAAVTATNTAYGHAGIGQPAIVPGQPAMVDVDSIALGEALEVKKLRGVYGFLQQDETADGFRMDGMVGMEVLGTTKWTLDYGTQQLYFAR